MTTNRSNWITLCSGLVAIGLASPNVTAGVVPIQVTNTADAGIGSLRQALLNANAAVGANIIEFDPRVFNIPRTITLTSGELAITDSVTIDGPAAALTISGNNNFRIFNINGGGTLNVLIRDLICSNGRVTGTNEGGAIYIEDETVTLTNCSFVSNSAVDSAGAVQVESAAATLNVNQCTFSTNTSAGGGGAIATDGAAALTIQDSTFNGNQAVAGGAINQAVGGSLLILNCALWQNTATGSDGGAVFLNSAFGSAVLRNSTFSGNGAQSDGGAVAIGGAFAGGLSVQNCTLVGNAATLHTGGALARTGGTSSITLASSILWGNTAPSGPSIFTTGTLNASVCMIASTSGVTTFVGDAFSIANVGVNPLVASLGNNGGQSMTHALQAGSPAIDTGSNALGLPTDQRGSGFVRVAQGSCGGPLAADIGAYEVQSIPPNCVAACCFDNGDCTLLSTENCSAQGGKSQGQGSTCASVRCAATCAADVFPPPGGNGVVNIDDLLEIVNDWGAGPGAEGDANNDGIVNIDDLLELINGWGACP